AVLNDCWSATGTFDDVAGGVAMASDSGTISSISNANPDSAPTHPQWSIHATPNGANKNCPNEPAAVPAPSAMPRFSGGSSLLKAESTRLNEQPDRPKPNRTKAPR